MIIVTGSVLARPDAIDTVLAMSLEHVHRSRLEPGCISHSVHRDAENPLRLFFFEQWSGMAALQTHFKVPASGAFVRAAAGLCQEAPAMQLYDAQQVQQR